MAEFTILLMRHGEIDPHYKGRFVGQVDVQLSEKGRKQALDLREILVRANVNSIYCSDLSRSCETASIISEGMAIPVTRVQELREISLGEWEGALIKDIREHFPDSWRDRGQDMAGYRPPSGESFRDLSSRVIPAFKRIVGLTTSNILIIGHAGVNRVIICHLLEAPLKNVLLLSQDYGRLNILKCKDGLFSVQAVNVTSGHY